MLGWRYSGFSVHNQVRVAADPQAGDRMWITRLAIISRVLAA
jgi:uncharacterized ferritin-like protein (DUF455 family)